MITNLQIKRRINVTVLVWKYMIVPNSFKQLHYQWEFIDNEVNSYSKWKSSW